MTKPAARLSDRAIQAYLRARPEKDTKYADYNYGLYLLLGPTGKPKWRRDFTFAGARKTYSFGTYPALSLADAREEAHRVQGLLDRGKDPMAEKKAQEAADVAQHQAHVAARTTNRFEVWGRKWYETKSPGWEDSYARTVIQRLEKWVFPAIGAKSFSELPRKVLLADVIEPIVEAGSTATAQRVADYLSGIFEFATVYEVATGNPAAKLRSVVQASPKKTMPALTDPTDVAMFVKRVDAYPQPGLPVVRWLMQFGLLTWTRPSEVRNAEWSEFRLDDEFPRWVVPGRRMKGPKKRLVQPPPHTVPLSTQALQLLREIHRATGSGRYVFPSLSKKNKTLSDYTVNSAILLMGYPPKTMVHHGFRSIASTNLNGADWKKEMVEVQLAHLPRSNDVHAAYNHASWMPQRRVMMQRWADWLDQLRRVPMGAEASMIDPPPADLWVPGRYTLKGELPRDVLGELPAG